MSTAIQIRTSFEAMNVRMGQGQFAAQVRSAERRVQEAHSLAKKVRNEDEAIRLMIRAEMDGLWTAVYQMANRLDEISERQPQSDE